MQLLHPEPSFRPRLAPAPAPACQSSQVCQSSQGEATADLRPAPPTSIGMLLTNHILQDGELVLLVLKPSVWFVLLSSLWFIGIVLILLCTSLVFHDQIPGRRAQYLELAGFLIAGRIMWAVLQWMGRLYMLTDLRIVRLSGVFNIHIFSCPLRKVARTRVTRPVRERLLRLGTIEIFPADPGEPAFTWQTIAKPDLVHEQIHSAINRARNGRRAAVMMG